MKRSVYTTVNVLVKKFLDHNEDGYEETFKKNKMSAVPGDKIL